MATAHQLFIADLHLCPQQPTRTQTFINWCQQYASKAEKLYILGDFFDSWIGADDHPSFQQSLIDCLKNLGSKGCKVYFMVGNHDFLIGETFAQRCTMQLIQDPTCIEVYGQRVLLSHGDLLCSDDKAHLAFRRFSQVKLWRRLFMRLPLSWRQAVAHYLLHRNRPSDGASYAIMDVHPDSVKAWMQKYKVQHLIHGHTHQPAVHKIILDKHPTENSEQNNYRYVVGAWPQEAEVLYWGKQQPPYLIKRADFSNM